MFHLCDLPGSSDGKATASNAGDLGSIPGWGRSPGEGNGNPLQYSCLENPMDRAAWQATAHGVAKSRTRLSGFTILYVPPIHAQGLDTYCTWVGGVPQSLPSCWAFIHLAPSTTPRKPILTSPPYASGARPAFHKKSSVSHPLPPPLTISSTKSPSSVSPFPLFQFIHSLKPLSASDCISLLSGFLLSFFPTTQSILCTATKEVCLCVYSQFQ